MSDDQTPMGKVIYLDEYQKRKSERQPRIKNANKWRTVVIPHNEFPQNTSAALIDSMAKCINHIGQIIVMLENLINITDRFVHEKKESVNSKSDQVSQLN